jgi:very-short-patch-repair endonuclease
MESEPLIDRVVPCSQCGRRNRVPARIAVHEAVCAECWAPLARQPTSGPTETPPNDKAARLFRFLKELVELRGRAIRTVDRYESVVWLADIPKHPLCETIDWSSSGNVETPEIWIEVRKPDLTRPPALPPLLKPWLAPADLEDSASTPELRARIPTTTARPADEEGVPFVLLKDRPDVSSMWERYFTEHWYPWAMKDRVLRPVQKVYKSLFSIYQKQKKLGEAYDVVVGLGLLVWKMPSGEEVRRHVVTAQASVTFDAERGVLTVGPAGDGANPRLEQDMLDPQYRPATSEQAAAEKRLKDLGDDIGNVPEVVGTLKQWAHALAPDAEVLRDLRPSTGASSQPRVPLAPALILRQRTDRSLVRLMEEILAKLKGGEPIPEGVERLVEIVEPTPGKGDPNGGAPPEEIFFPLPANEEQLEIVRRLSAHQGVLVQGPPGTGKSHTIANLICHLLASGQRILVTSHTARALQVLKAKIPAQVAHLCVQLLGNDLEALESLEHSVRGITDRSHHWSETRNQERLQALTQRLKEARKLEAKFSAELRAIRESETYRHPQRFGNYRGTAQQIATRLKAEESKHAWIPKLRNEDVEPPLANAEAAELLALLREIGPELESELAKTLPTTIPLPGPDLFTESVEREAEARKAAESTPANRGLADTLARQPRDKLIKLSEGVRTLDRALDPLKRSSERWVTSAVAQCLEGRKGTWQRLLSTTKEQLTKAEPVVSRISNLRITGLPERDRIQVRSEAQTLLRHLESGNSLGFWIFRPKAIRPSLYLATNVRVDGRRCNETPPLKLLIQWIDVAEAAYALKKAWSPHTQAPAGSLANQLATFSDLVPILERCLALTEIIESLNRQIATITDVDTPIWHDAQSLGEFREAVSWALLRDELSEAKASIDVWEQRLEHLLGAKDCHRVTMDLLDAVKARNAEAYREVHRELARYEELVQKMERRNGFLARLSKPAPGLAKELRSTASEGSWDERLASFVEAWNWARADAWLTRLNDPEGLPRLSTALDEQRRTVLSLLAELGAEKAWAHCFARMTEHERQHLQAWKMAMSRIGKGTGKYASKHRRAAREHMDQCRSAIPAWILPIHRVAETVRATRDLYDVVIVDEASQSGVEALFLSYLARKIVIVGDDKQISPEYVGIHREDVDALREKHISDLPHSDAYGVENSFFDQAAIRYRGRIRLREHFRCMPEIIQFSNNLCYGSEPLIPLRQYGTGRLTPVVATTHVASGYQEGQSPRIVNPPEADAIVERILACCKDGVYDGKSMGVISLLGRDQARLIEEKLLETLGPQEMEKRELICGDAYAFQGDERDIMFLSLVSAPGEGHRIGTLATEAAKRRFNVAASRARDQMWLFHSATLSDLSPSDLRYSLLEYCLDPKVRQTPDSGVNVAELERAAARRRAGDPPPAPFESWFEVDVFLEIVRRGYRVLPQYELAGYRIDLLVEGMKGRLAVECDGDVWHGADRYEQDMARQRILERCGLRFWRVRGSTFCRSPSLAVQRLCETLDALGITAWSGSRS